MLSEKINKLLYIPVDIAKLNQAYDALILRENK